MCTHREALPASGREGLERTLRGSHWGLGWGGHHPTREEQPTPTAGSALGLMWCRAKSAKR